MEVYDSIIQGSESSEENARDFAQHFDFSECNTQEHRFDVLHHTYIDELNGIGIYYNSTADYYFFTKVS